MSDRVCIRRQIRRRPDDDRSLSVVMVPEDVLIKVLSWLPVKSLLRFRCLSKRWHDIISSDPHFIQLHSQQQSKQQPLLFSISRPSSLPPPLPPKVEKNEVSNIIPILLQFASIYKEGRLLSKFEISTWQWKTSQVSPIMLPTRFDLICFKYAHHDIFHVCNPSTLEVITLPAFRYTEGDSFGFGYVKSTDEYKIVHLIPPHEDDEFLDEYYPNAPTICMVFTLGMTKDSPSSYASPWAWRHIGNSPYNVNHLQNPAFVDGALHWLINPIRHPELMTDIEHPLILAFNVESEEFSIVPRPRGCGLSTNKDLQLVELRGLLCLSCIIAADKKLDIWMLMNEKNGSSTFTWVKEFSIDMSTLDDLYCRSYTQYYDGFYVPRDIQDDGNKVLIATREGRSFYYHRRTASFSGFMCDDLTHPLYSFYTESLRSLRHVLQRSFKFDQITEVTTQSESQQLADLDSPIYIVRVFAIYFCKEEVSSYGGYITNRTGQFVAIQGKKLDTKDSIEVEAKAILYGLQFAREESIQRIGLISSAKELVDAILTGERQEKFQKLEKILTMITNLLSEFSWAQIFHDQRMSTQVGCQIALHAIWDETTFCFHEPPEWFIDG